MQYTGLKDKNGTEIYEGDIIKHLGISQVVDVRIHAILLLDGIDSGQDKVNALRPITVLGNIYQNPELLEVKKYLNSSLYY